MSFINIDVLRDKNSQIIFLSQLVSAVCEKMMSIGLIWFLTKEYSINIVPWFLALSFFPHLLMAFYSTPIINRIGPMKTVISAEFFRGFILLVLFFGLHFFRLGGESFLTALFLSSFLIGFGSSLFNPAILSLPPKLVNEDKIVGLNALIDSSMSISTILGATFAIIILNIVDLKILILLNALSFFWAGFLQLGLTPLKEISETSQQEIPLAMSPVSVLKKYPEIARMLGSFLFLNLVFTPILVMIPWYVQKIYGGDSRSLAIIEGSMGLGAFLTGLYLSLSSFQVRDEKRISMIAIVSFFFGVLFLLFTYSSFTWEGAVVLFLIGTISTFLNIQVLTYFQTALHIDEIPAIMTAVNIISAASVPLSLTFSGLIFPYVSIPQFAKSIGILIVIIAFVMPTFLKGKIWKLE